MKKLIALLLTTVILCFACGASFHGADVYDPEAFRIENGILLEYIGSETEVEIPSQVYYIGDNAFAENTTVARVIFTSNVYYVGDKAFYGCTALTAVENASSVTSVGYCAFTGTPYLAQKPGEYVTFNNVLIAYKGIEETVEIPSYVNAVAPGALEGNTQIRSVVINSTVTEIGYLAFNGCTNLANVEIPKSVTTIGADAFQGTSWLKGKTGFIVEGNGILVAYKGTQQTVTIPQEVLQIAPKAFAGNTGVTGVIMPDTVYLVGMEAFKDCAALTNVTFSNKCIYIDDYAFANCESLKEAKIPDSVKSLGEGAFYNCANLAAAVVGTGVTVVDKETFAQCGNMESAKISEGTKDISTGAFRDCESLDTVMLPNTLTNIDESAFTGYSAMKIFAPSGSYSRQFAQTHSIQAYNQKGDVNNDNTVDIKDATYIQKALADYITLTAEEKLLADVLLDGSVTINDVTALQKQLVK